MLPAVVPTPVIITYAQLIIGVPDNLYAARFRWVRDVLFIFFQINFDRIENALKSVAYII